MLRRPDLLEIAAGHRSCRSCGRRVFGRGDVCKSRTCPGYSRVWAGDQRRKLFRNLTANALRDWCRFSKAGSAYIAPGSPWQTPYVESFRSRIRDELLAVELSSSLAEAQVLVGDWRQDYNQHRPHSALG